MDESVKRLLFWTPRILCIAFAVFVSLFALDVFGEGYNFFETILAFLIHLIPTGIILIALAVSWRWEWMGAITFIALGIVYIMIFRDREFGWSTYLIISGPLFLLGVLFLINWLCHKQLRTGSHNGTQ
ncbi:hypothetical protein ACFL5Z_13605 [Planctomycetota bacterium]